MNEERRQCPSLAELARERLGVRVPTCTVTYEVVVRDVNERQAY